MTAYGLKRILDVLHTRRTLLNSLLTDLFADPRLIQSLPRTISQLVLLKLIVVAVLCVRRNAALRAAHSSSTGPVTHKLGGGAGGAGHHGDVEACDSAAKTSVWRRLHGDHRTDVIPSSCSVSCPCLPHYVFAVYF